MQCEFSGEKKKKASILRKLLRAQDNVTSDMQEQPKTIYGEKSIMN